MGQPVHVTTGFSRWGPPDALPAAVAVLLVGHKGIWRTTQILAKPRCDDRVPQAGILQALIKAARGFLLVGHQADMADILASCSRS
jgi:hypothetical protein